MKKLGKVIGWAKEWWELFHAQGIAPVNEARAHVDIMQLEDRIFYSASPLAMLDSAGEIGPDAVSVENVEALLQSAMAMDVMDAGEVPGFAVALEDLSLLDVEPSPEFEPNSVRHEVAFVDAGLENVETLLSELRASQDIEVDWTIVYLDPTQDGVLEIGDYLAASSVDFDAVHLVTHGSADGVQIGSVWLDASTWWERREAIGVWQSGLVDEADLLIYGCSVASTFEGQAWLGEMAAGIGVDLAASSDMTGHGSLSGNWELEFQIGEISTEVFASASVQQAWEGVLATYSVTSTNDSGVGTLRQAVIDANANAGTDTIQFSVGSGVISISLSSALPTLTGTVVIDGWTQPGYTTTPIVVIDGSDALGDGLVLTSTADNSTIRGLVIRDFNGDGIQINSGSTGNTIVGNYIGSFASSGGNLGSSEANTGNGINVLGSNNTIGGTTSANRNVISGNLSNGILLDGSGSNNNLIFGNYIGTEATGTVSMGNTGDGIRFANSANTNTIGGTTTAHRNIIAGNGSDGIEITGSSSHSNIFRNNWIGLGSDGLTVIGNTEDGIRINGGADNTVIGGVNLGNVMLGNRGAGIEVDGTSTGTIIQGNLIGVNVAGTVIHGSGQSGILLKNSASDTTIGGTNNGEGNTITDSGLMSTTLQAGIQVQGSSSTGNTILGNSIYGNRGLGIDLGTSGITVNDSGDGDSGSNGLQNYPTLSAATVNAAGTSVTVSGSINTNASVTGLILHFYATPSSGNVNDRQGRRYLGSTTVTTDVSGNATFTNVTVSGYSGSVAAGELITATATTPGTNGNTSEFSLGYVASSSAGNRTPTSSQLVTSTDGGISMNQTGYNSYLETEDGSAILGGRTQLTMEFQLRSGPIAGDFGYTLASYVTPTVSDALYIGVFKSGVSENVTLQINGSSVGIVTDVDLLFDGNQHALSFTWSQTSGTYALYRDGVQIGSGTGLASGQTISTGGRLAFGVDLDGASNSWNPTGLYQGTINDIRVFGDVRTAAEVTASYASNIPYNEDNLLANWRLDDLSTEMTTSNAVGGNSLVLRGFTQWWASADSPSLELRLDENTVTGTVVGQVQGQDVEREQRITSLLAADSSLRYSAETGKFYKLVQADVTWASAHSSALATTLSGVSGQLGTIRSAAEQALFTGFYASLNDQIWLGGSDATVEGEWRWKQAGFDQDVFWSGAGSSTTGGPANGSYTNWVNSGEPNNSGVGEDNLLVWNSVGQWNDADNSNATPSYVVEWNADDVLDATNALTYSITSQTVSGAFSINSDTGIITVANGTLLNYESHTSHTLNVRVTDGSGATFDRAFTVAINDLTESNTAPSDLSPGIELNTDGGNNAYLRTTSGGSVLGGLTAMTLEVQYTMETPSSSSNTLLSYSSPLGAVNNEVTMMVDAAGKIQLTMVSTSAITTGAYTQLLDGNMHAVAVSWDNTNGDVRFFIDGQLVETTTGFRTGATIAAGGTLVLGQDQDTVDGSYDSAQRFSGTLHDVRVWNHAVSGEQISQNYQQKLADTPTGLVANWRMTGLASGTTVVDAVGGVNLTVANVTGGGWTTSTPTASLSVSENATVGTVVGSVAVSDAMNTRDIVLDGLFQESANPGSFTKYTTGQAIGNWTVQSGEVDVIGTLFQSSPLGGRSIDLNGTMAGAISQTLSTTAGRQYQVIFNATGNWDYDAAIKEFRVSAGGTSQDFSMSQPSGWSASNMLFSGRSMTFTAIDSNTTLAFQSLETGAAGAVIADVRVIEIPAAVQSILSNDSTMSYDAGTGKFYKTVNTSVSFATAQAAATATVLNGVAGQLLTIGSSYENNLAWNMARGISKDLWLGASDSATEGTWNWYTGTSAGGTFWVGSAVGTLQSGYYANWFAGEPNDSGGTEDYAQFYYSSGTWNDIGSGSTIAYVIEWDASEVLSNVRYAITSDPIGAFAIDANTGEITVASGSPLSEIATNPSVTIQVTDAAGNSYSEAITISINAVNDNTPVITSNGGGVTAAISLAENTTAVTTITATDADLPAQTLTYSIVGGADASFFSISSTTGGLSFVTGRDFETPADAGADNVYDVIVRADDGANWDDQTIAVTVTNVNEAPTELYSVPNVTDANVLGYYGFTSANNLGRDDAGGTSPITFTGTVNQITGPSGSGALDISGGAYGNIASMTTGGAMTIASWVRFDSTSANGWDRVVDLGQANAGGIGNVVIGRFGTTNNLSFTIEKNGSYIHRATVTNGITNGAWMHVAATVDASGNMTLYVNGIAAATASGVAPDVGVRTNQFIGKSNFAVDGAFDGAIDDLLIASGAMSAANIANLYQQTSALTITENTANGTLLTTVYATDPDAGNTYTYSLIDDASGAFAIHSSSGQITVNNSSQLDLEGGSTLSVVVRATDQGGLSHDETISISLTGVNEAPTFVAGNGRTYTSIGGMQFGNAVAQQTDGKYVMAGWSDSGGTRDFAVVRYNFDGSLDTTFGAGSGYVITTVGSGNDEAQDIRVLSNGKILVQGYAVNGGSNDIAFVQYNSDGSLDTSFGSGTGKAMSGIAGEDTGYGMAIQSDGKFVVGGVAGNDFLVARFNSNGTLDSSFGTSGHVTTDFSSNSDTGQSVAIQSDGKILVAGRAYNNVTFTDFAIARYNTDGSLDTSFNSTGKVMVDFGSSTDQGYGLAIQSDGKILINGFTNAAGTTDNGLIRLTTVGALDTSFNTTGRVITSIGSGSDFAFDLKVQSDGRILSSGYASVSGNDFTVVRYHSDGSLDTSYGTGGIAVSNFSATTDDRGTRMFLQADGKVVLAGCTTQSGTYDLAIARYNENGTADGFFNASNTLGGTVSYTENGSAVVLDSNVQVLDAELTYANNFSGATLTLARIGGANADDVFSATGVLSALTQGGNLVVSGTTIGTVTTNSGGSLVLTFNGNATQSRVHSAMQAIGYSNASDAPTSSVQIGWTLNDGNTGSQGTGGALLGTGTSTISVTSLNDAPVLNTSKTPVMNTVTEDSGAVPVGAVGTLVSSLIDFATPSGQLDNVTDGDGTSTIGIAVTSADETYGAWWFSTDNGTNWARMGTAQATSARLLAADANTRVYFQVNTATEIYGNVGDNLSFRAWDMTTGTNGGTASVTTNGGTTAFSASLDTASIILTGVADAARFLGNELITNGSFTSNISGWSTTGTVLSGSNAMSFGFSSAVGPHTAYQSISTVAGQTYELSFDYKDDSGSRNQSLQVTANGTSNLLTTSHIATSVTGFSYRTYFYTFVADSSSTTITFTDTSDTSGLTISGTTSSDGFVDNVSVRQRNGHFGTLGYTENAGSQTLFPSFTLSDIDSTNLTGATVQFTSGYLNSEDSLVFNNQLGITGNWNSTTGILTLSGTTTVANYQTALQSVAYSNSNDSPGLSKSISFSVTDGTATSLVATRDVSITQVNDAPVLAPYSPTLPLSENGGAFSATIASLLGTSVSDVDSAAAEGIAIYGLTLAGGTLEYSLDGTNWAAVSGVSTSNSLLLRASDQMRFTPSTTNGGQTLIRYNAWDQTSGSAGGFANVTTTGGTTAFSAATDTITVNVTSVNDAPVLDNTGTMTLSGISEDQINNSGQTVASIIASAGGDRITDVDTGAVEGIAITSLSSGNGTWQYSLDGTNWNDVGSVSTSSALLLSSTDFVRFVPNGVNATSASFDFQAWDTTTGSSGSKVSIASSGGSTAFSIATEQASIIVTAVNDNIGAPSDVDATANTVAESATVGTLVGITASAIDVDSGDTVTYSLDYSAGGRYAIHSSTGVVTVAGPLNAENQFLETILVRATSSDGSAVTQGYTITVTSVNEAPSDIRIPITVASEDFESGASGWSITQTVAGGGSLTNYLGGWGVELGATPIYKDFTLSGSQSSVTITFDMYELDTWDGEAFKVWVDGVEYSSQSLWMDQFGDMYLGRENELAITQQMTNGLTSLGGDGGFEDEIHRYSFTITTASTSLRLGFSSTLDSLGANESWGVDNLSMVENRPSLSVAENATIGTAVGSVQGYDVDAGTTLSYSLTDSAGGRFAIHTSSGAITVADGTLLNYEAATYHTVTVQVSDGSLTYSKAVTINLTNVNEAPAAVADVATAVEAGGVNNGTAGNNPTDNVLTNDGDVDAGDTKTVSGVAAGTTASASGFVGTSVNGSFGSINIAADGTYTYTVNNSNATVQALAVGQSLNDVFTYTMHDTAGLTSTAQVTVTIQGANDAPVNVLSSDFLMAGSTIYSSNGQNRFSVQADGNAVLYGPSGNILWQTNTSTGTNLNLQTDGNLVLYASNGTAIWSSSTSNMNANGGFDLSVTNDGRLLFTDEQTGAVLWDSSVGKLADASSAAPVAGVLGTTVFVSEAAIPGNNVATLITRDVDSSSFSYSLVGGRTDLFDISGSNIVVKTGAAFNFEADSSYLLGVQTTDASGASYVETITIRVIDINEAPNAVLDTATAVEAGGTANAMAGTNPSGNVLTNDTDVDAFSTRTVVGVLAGVQTSAATNVGLAVAGTFGSITIAADGSYTYTVNNNHAAVQALRSSSDTLTDVFSYTMQDGGSLPGTTQITVTIQGANDAPVQTGIEGAALNYTENDGSVFLSSSLALSDLDDANLASATVQITGNFLTSQDVLAFTDQNGIVGTWDSGTGTLTLTGTATRSQYETALRSVTYANTSELPSTSTRTVTFTVHDGALASNTVTRDINVASVNDAPINILPGVQTTGINATLTLAGANAVQISDVDAASNSVRLTLTASNGTLTLASTSGLTITTGDGVNDATIVMTGTLASINTALDGLQFIPTNGYTGSANISLLTEDLGNSGTGGNLSDSDNLAIQVGGLRFQEGVSGYTGTQDTYVTSTGSSTSYGSATSVIIDDPSHHGLIRFDNLFGNGAGQIAYGSTITSATLSVYVTGTDALDSVLVHRMLSTWSEASTWNSLTSGVQANNTEAATTVSYTVDAGVGGWISITGITSTLQAWSDGAINYGWALLGNGADGWTFHSSEFATVSLRPYLTVAYDAPQPANLDLDANNSAGVSGSGVARGWTENGGPVGIADTDATISDADSASLQSMVIRIANLLDGTAESLAANTSGTSIVASYNSSTGELTLTGSDSVANYQQVLRTVVYDNSSESPSTTSRLITVQAADAYVQSNIATSTVTVTALNDAPVLDNSGAMSLTSIQEDQTSNGGNTVASIIASAGGDRITDVDAGAVEGIAVTALTSGNGTWEFSINGGSSWTAIGSVSGSSALLLRASDLVRLVPNGQNATSGDLTFRAWDQTGVTIGQQGTKVDTSVHGGTTPFSSATEMASITVTAVNDAPTDITTGTLTIAENSGNSTTIGTAVGVDIDSGEVLAYSLSDDAGGRFAIHSSTGVITVANSGLLNFEASTWHSITIRVTDSGLLTYDKVFTVNLTDVDEFDTGLVTDSNATANLIAENIANGSLVGITAIATDNDATTNAIAYSLDNDAGGRFTINSSTGVVTVLDGSLLNYEVDSSHLITIRATSADMSFSTEDFTVHLSDVNEGSIGALADSDGATNQVAENATNGTLVGVIGSAVDPDGSDTITYSLDDDAGGRFAIDASTGVVTVAGGIDREVAGSYDIVIRATSSDTSSTIQTFTIQVDDVDEFDVIPIVDQNGTVNSVVENASVGTVVGITAFASDADATTHAITYTLVDDDGGRFAIDGSTGVVNVAGAIDREADGASRNITVRATSTDGSYQELVMSIAIVDANEASATTPSDSDAAANAIDENVSIGTTVGITASSLDADATNHTVTYSLTSNPNGWFQIDANTGVVTVAAALDREVTGGSRSIIVRATSSDLSYAEQTFAITINDVDEFNVSAISDTNAAANSVVENASNGTVVGVTALASDGDATTNAITYSLDDDAGGRFAINASTGVVTVADGSLLDFELQASHLITVRATSADTSFSVANYTILLSDANEGGVGAVSDSDAASNHVSENATVGTVVGITGHAVDPDGTDVVTYSLDDDAGGRFAIHASTGVVTVAGGINREVAGSYDIVIRATSSDTSSTIQTFTIQVDDVDEFDVIPIVDQNGAVNSVLENATVGTLVGITAFASDADATTHAIIYTLVDDDGGRFAIHGSTGVVTVAGAIDRDVDGASRNITVRATSADGSYQEAIFAIGIGDVNEFSTSVPTDSDGTVNAIDENVSIGTEVGITVLASDADATNATMTYSLTSNPNGWFQIDANTGVVTVAASLDREVTGGSRNIIVRATSSDLSYAEQTFAIAINDVDEFNITAISDSNGAVNTVVENASNGTVVGVTASASDGDATTSTITYSLDDDAGGRFAIQASTGVVTVADGSLLDFETQSSHLITVRATSADTSFSVANYTIVLSDANEGGVGAVSDSDAASNHVAENAVVGTVVGITGHAADPDGTDSVTYSLDDDAGGRFAIDASTGVVTVAGAIDREAAGSYDIVIRAVSSDTTSTTQTFTVQIDDVDEFDVTAISDSNGVANTVMENASNGTVVGITAFASDGDATINTITYSLDDDAGGRFAIDASTGMVTVAGAIDREVAGSYDITIRATSSDTTSTTQTFTVQIDDLDEFDVIPVVDTNAAVNSVLENATVGTLVGITAFASDADATTNSITYTLADDDGGRFAIHGSTGVVTVAGAIDRDVDGASRNITVRATSADGSYQEAIFAIGIGDVNEFSTSVPTDSDGAVNAIDENVSIGTAVGITVLASDADATNATMTYSLTSNPNGWFQIDANTGVVTVAASLDREVTGGSRNIIVRATSSDLSYAEQTFAIAINDVDEFNITAISDSNGAVNTVVENASNGTVVGVTAFASDGDATTNTITYSLDDDAGGRFAIDASTGVVIVAGAIDREAAGSYDIVIRATSSDSSSTTATVTVQIEDLDEFDVGLLADIDGQLNSIGENASDGSSVGLVVFGEDGDATQNVVTYRLIDDAGGRFAIDGSTGMVRVANGSLLNFEAESGHPIRVRAESSDGSSIEQWFMVSIEDRQEAPQGVSVQYTTTFIDDVVVGSPGLLANASDPDGDSLSVFVVSGPVNGVLTWQSDGGFIYEPVSGVTGVETIVYRVFDGFDSSSDLTVTIVVVMPAVQAPGANSGGGSASQAPTDSVSDSSNVNTSSERDVTPGNKGDGQPLAMGLGGVVEARQEGEKNQAVVSVGNAAIPTMVPAAATEALQPLGVTEISVGSEGMFRLTGQSLEGAYEGRGWQEQAKSNRSLLETSSASGLLFEGSYRHQMDESVGALGNLEQLVMQTVIGTGAVIWVVQGLQLLATLLSVTPAWLHMDPLNIVSNPFQNEEEEQEASSAEEKLFDRKRSRIE